MKARSGPGGGYDMCHQASPAELNFSPLPRTLRGKNLEFIAGSWNSDSVPCFPCARLYHLEVCFLICKIEIRPKLG